MRISSRTKYMVKRNSNHTNYESYDGNLVPSVTTILKVIGKESLMQWANSLGWKRKSLAQELNDASIIGTYTHNYIEAFILGKNSDINNIWIQINNLPYKLSTKAYNAINSFHLWWDENGQYVEAISTEVEMCCDYYGGTCDFICRYKGKLTIIDFKTSSDFHPTMYLQLAAYANIYEEIFDLKIEELAILRMDKANGSRAILRTIEEVPGGDREFYFNAFDCALNLYKFMNVIDKDWHDE